jgi:hypothetical protein
MFVALAHRMKLSEMAMSWRHMKAGDPVLLVEVVMFPETDELSYIFSNTAMVLFKRRLVDRVLRVWLEYVREGQFPRREQIEFSMMGEDQANCLVIAVQSPVEFSHFVSIGENLSFAHCPNDSFAGVLLSHLPQVLSERRCLMIEARDASRYWSVISERPIPVI